MLQYLTGSQWRSYKRGHDEVKRVERYTSLIALFWTSCRRVRNIGRMAVKKAVTIIES